MAQKHDHSRKGTSACAHLGRDNRGKAFHGQIVSAHSNFRGSSGFGAKPCSCTTSRIALFSFECESNGFNNGGGPKQRCNVEIYKVDSAFAHFRENAVFRLTMTYPSWAV